MKIPRTTNLQKEGEAHVQKLTEKMGHSWRESGKESLGIDGFIEIVRFEQATGQVIGVQVKSGRSYLTTRRRGDDTARHLPQDRRKVRLKDDHLTYFKECRFPVILVFFDPNSENAFWGPVDSDSATAFEVPHVFDRYSSRSIARVADRWHSNYPKVLDPRIPSISIAATKKAARTFYEELRKRGCVSPAYGPVRFTLRGWRHITRQNSERSKVVRSFELLGAAKKIISEQPNFHVCRRTEAGHILYKQTARITHPTRADAIVSVITERIANGPRQFLSVYEHVSRRQRPKRQKRKSKKRKVGGR